ncbi:MAG: hypothetical protein R2731_09390 [Nocardioides sp.]
MTTGGRDGPPSRVRVESPRSAVRRRPQPVAEEIDAQTELGVLYLRSLVRAHLRLSGGILVLLVTLVGTLPLAFAVVPALFGRRFFGMPLAWGVLGLLVYPLLLWMGWAYVRRAERLERSFTDMVEKR